MVLVVMAGSSGGCDGQQQHVELFEEPDPALRDLPTSRVAEQPRTMTLNCSAHCGGGVAARTREGTEGKGSAGAWTDRGPVDREGAHHQTQEEFVRGSDVHRDAGGVPNDPRTGVAQCNDGVVDGPAHVVIDGAVRIVGPHRDPKVPERRCPRRREGVREPAIGVQRADRGFQSGDDVAGTAHLHASAGHIGFAPATGAARPAGDVAHQWDGLPCRLVAVKATEVSRNPGGATDFGPVVEARQPGRGSGGATAS